MTQQQHPITPPPELIQKWGRVAFALSDPSHGYVLAAQWGADAELEACCERQALLYGNRAANELRAARRPKPPSMKQQALEELDGIAAVFRMSHGGNLVCDKIRRALEQLDD